MSKENVKSFYEFLKQDAAVVDELKKASEEIDSAEKAVEVVIAFAKEKGFEFTAEDLAEFEKEIQKELSVEDLDKINAAGGVGGLCFGVGIGWGGDARGGGRTICYVIGLGGGVTWRELNQEEKEVQQKVTDAMKARDEYCPFSGV